MYDSLAMGLPLDERLLLAATLLLGMKLTLRQTAKLLDVSEDGVYRWIREESHRASGRRFHRARPLEWAASRRMRVSSEVFGSSGTPHSAAAPRLSSALIRGGVHHDVGGKNRESMLREVVARMPIDEQDRDRLCDSFVAREALASTGVGDGIARRAEILRSDRTLNFTNATLTHLRLN
jgi:hypothetical protein